MTSYIILIVASFVLGGTVCVGGVDRIRKRDVERAREDKWLSVASRALADLTGDNETFGFGYGGDSLYRRISSIEAKLFSTPIAEAQSRPIWIPDKKKKRKNT